MVHAVYYGKVFVVLLIATIGWKTAEDNNVVGIVLYYHFLVVDSRTDVYGSTSCKFTVVYGFLYTATCVFP